MSLNEPDLRESVANFATLSRYYAYMLIEAYRTKRVGNNHEDESQDSIVQPISL